MPTCPKPSLHTVEGAPIQKLADLLRTATEFDEIAGHLVDEYDLLAIELERIDALRAAVHALNGGAAAAVVDHKLIVQAEGEGKDRRWWFSCACSDSVIGRVRSTQGAAIADFQAHATGKAVTA